MRENKFFRINGLATAIHTPETKKIWYGWPDDVNRSDKGRAAILKYAKELGFEVECDDNVYNLGIYEEAFNYLLNQFPNITGIKSYVLRKAIIHYS